MSSVANERVAGTDHRAARGLRAAVLGPRGGGTTRRRASDAFRLGFAVVVVAVSVPVMRAESKIGPEPGVRQHPAERCGAGFGAGVSGGLLLEQDLFAG